MFTVRSLDFELVILIDWRNGMDADDNMKLVASRDLSSCSKFKLLVLDPILDSSFIMILC